MKSIKFLLSAFILSLAFFSCDEEYEEVNDYTTFEGTFTLYKIEKEVNGKLENVTSTEKGDNGMFIQIRDSLLLTYVNALRDSINSYVFYISDEQFKHIYAKPLKVAPVESSVAKLTADEEGNGSDTSPSDVKPGYTYYGTYRFTKDSLYIEQYPVTVNGGVDFIQTSKPVKQRRVYARPQE